MNGSGHGHPREQLSAYLDDQLAVEERASVDRHLAACDECRAELEALRRIVLAVAAEEVPPVPLDLAGRIARGLDVETDARPHRRRFIVPATIAATITAIGILVALQWREGRVIVPSMPVPQEQARPSDELKHMNAPVQPPPASPEPEVAPRGKKEDATRRDAWGKDMNVAPAQTPEPSLKQKADEGAAAPTGVPGGVVGGAVGAVGGVEGGVPGGAPSPCAEQFSDSGLRGGWEVPDVDVAARDLARVARDVGGISQWRGITDGRPFVLIVPRDRFDEVFYALRARGVTGLVTPPALAEGVACAGISVTLTAVPAAPAPTPR